MKFRLYATLIGLTAAAFAACNNGAYDAQPSVDGSQIQNPINPDLPAAKGTMKVRLDGGQFFTFDSCRFERVDSTLTIGAVKFFVGENTRQLILVIPKYKGIMDYPITTDTLGNAGYYATLWGMDVNTLTAWATSSPVNPLTGQIKVELSTPGEVKGSFSFTASKYYPEYDVNNKVVLTEGTFWATPQQ